MLIYPYNHSGMKKSIGKMLGVLGNGISSAVCHPERSEGYQGQGRRKMAAAIGVRFFAALRMTDFRGIGGMKYPPDLASLGHPPFMQGGNGGHLQGVSLRWVNHVRPDDAGQ